jgi:hypothetical protein
VPAKHRPLAWRLLKSATLLCLAGCGAMSAPALAARSAAAPPIATPGAVSAAEAVAEGFWGTAACSGHVAIAWRVRARRVNAVSSWANRHTAYGDPDHNFACRVEFNPRAPWTWAKFCTVLVHEFGHLTGHEHSPDPHDIMAPLFTEPLPACVASRRGATAASRGRLRPRARSAAWPPAGIPGGARSAT